MHPLSHSKHREEKQRFQGKCCAENRKPSKHFKRKEKEKENEQVVCVCVWELYLKIDQTVLGS